MNAWLALAAWAAAALLVGLPLAAAINRNKRNSRRHPAHDDALDQMRRALNRKEN